MKNIKTKHNKGFTLIELLVVVAIIGVLATIVLSSLSSARAKARDTKRLAEIKQIQNALELFHLDHNRYPGIDAIGAEGYFAGNCSDRVADYGSGWQKFRDDLSPYITLDEVGGPWPYCILYFPGEGLSVCPLFQGSASVNSYSIIFSTEKSNFKNVPLTDKGRKMSPEARETYCVYSPE